MFCGHSGTSFTSVQPMWSNRADAAEAQYSLYCRQAGALPLLLLLLFRLIYRTLDTTLNNTLWSNRSHNVALCPSYISASTIWSGFTEYFYRRFCDQTDPLMLIMLQVPFPPPILVLLLCRVAIENTREQLATKQIIEYALQCRCLSYFLNWFSYYLDLTEQ